MKRSGVRISYAPPSATGHNPLIMSGFFVGLKDACKSKMGIIWGKKGFFGV
jgi:hypothetical protein